MRVLGSPLHCAVRCWRIMLSAPRSAPDPLLHLIAVAKTIQKSRSPQPALSTPGQKYINGAE